MADQEFLASFAVDIDEAGVARLQTILSDNRDLANEVAAAFEAAASAIRGYEQAAAGKEGSTGEGKRDTGSRNGENSVVPPTAREDVRGRLMGPLYGTEGSLRDWFPGNMEVSFLTMAAREAGRFRNSPQIRQESGLSFDPGRSERSSEYTSLQDRAYEVLTDPVAKARAYMQRALDAETEGADTQAYVDKVIGTLRKPLQQVKEMYDSLAFEESSGSHERGGNGESSGTGLNLESARADLAAFREEAARPVSMSANASGMTSAARAAYNNIKSMFSSPITIRAKVEKDGDGEEGITVGDPVKMSIGGRFSKPTDVQVAEDGDAEYIIPVKKEERAIPLLRQLLAELSPSARQSLSLGDASLPLSGGLTAGNAVAGSITQTNQNVSAPVSIEVHASGANPEQVGRSVYNTAERYLLRTLKGAFQT